MFGLGKYSDETIIQKIKSGDEKILIYLYKDYFKLIKNFILKNSGEEDQVDDILQETIIALWRNVQKPSFLLHSKFSTYVLAITKNIWFKELKKKSKLIRIDHSNQHSLKTNTLTLLSINPSSYSWCKKWTRPVANSFPIFILMA